MEATTAARLQTWALHEQGKDLVRRAVRALGPEVRVMPLKGMLLTALGIVHPAERPMRDVDLLADSLSERALVQRLRRADFRVAEVSRAPGYVSLAHAAHGRLWLDLHTRAAPIGLGRLPRAYLFDGAAPNDSAFGVRVFVPARARLVVQLVANVLKDHVVHARPSAADDLAAVLASCADSELDAIAGELARVSLARGGTMVLMWAERHTSSPGLNALSRKLLEAQDRRRIAAELDALEHSHGRSVLARVRARACADSPTLRTLAALAAGSSLLLLPFRKRWLAVA